jgi:hypothetical protein
MCLGPTTSYYVHQEVTIAGQRFVAATAVGPNTDLASIKNAVFMRGTTQPSIATVYFGVLREVRMFEPVGSSNMDAGLEDYLDSFSQPVLVVDWFERPEQVSQRFYAGLNVPVLQHKLMSPARAAAVFESGRLCDPQLIVPIAPTLAKHNGATAASQWVVLHRDPDLIELAGFSHAWAAW